MKNRDKKVILMLFAILISMAGVLIHTDTAEASTKVSESYLNKVKKAYYDTMKNFTKDNYFALQDLNGDGVPELIIKNDNIYTYTKGKVVSEEGIFDYDFGSVFTAFYPACNTLEVQYEHMGVGCKFYYECDNNYDLKGIYYYKNDTKDNPDIKVPSYKLDGKDVTEKEFINYTASLGENHSIPFYKATKSNLEKYLYKLKTYTYMDLGISKTEESHKLIKITGVTDTGFEYEKAKFVDHNIVAYGKTYKVKFSTKISIYIYNEILVNYKQVMCSSNNMKKIKFWIPLYKNGKVTGLAEQYLP